MSGERFSEEKIQALMGQYNPPSMELHFQVVAAGTAGVPKTEFFSEAALSSNPANPAPIENTGILSGLPVRLEDTQRLPAVEPVVATAAGPASHRADPPERQHTLYPGHGRHEKQPSAFVASARRVGRVILRRGGKVATVTLVGTGIVIGMLWPGAVNGEHQAAPAVPAAPSGPLPSLAAKRAVLQNAGMLRETAMCAPEATVMAEYLDRKQDQGIDMSVAYPTSAEYRAAAKLAAANHISCTVLGNANPQVEVNGVAVTADSLLDYMFDARRLCTVDGRLTAQADVAGQDQTPVYEQQMDHLSKLFEASEKECQ